MPRKYMPDPLKETFLANYSATELKAKIEKEAYFGILANHDTIYNPLAHIPSSCSDHIAEYYAYLMQNPDYFYLIIKCLFGMDSFPAQCAVLKQLYTHRFPILIGSRGFSKSSILAMYALIVMITRPGIKCVITGAGFRQAKLVFDGMEKIWKAAPVLRSCYKGNGGIQHGADVWTFSLGDSVTYAIPVGHDGSKVRGYRANVLLCVSGDTLIQTDRGLVEISQYLNHDCYDVMNINNEFETPDKVFKTHKQDVYEITTVNGYNIKCSAFHQLWTTNGKEACWKLAKDLTTNDHIELDTNDYFPSNYIERNGLVVDEKIGYLLGILISEGTVTSRNNISFSQTNYDLIEEVKEKLSFEWKEYYKEAYRDARGWDCKESWTLTYNDVQFRDQLYELGLDYAIANNKTIPWCILQSPRSVVIGFLKGLFIGDGSCFKYTDKKKVRGGISYYSASEKLINQLHILLLKFNIIGCKIKRKSKLSTNPNWVIKISNNSIFTLHDLINNKYWNQTISELFHFNRSTYCRIKGNSFIAETSRCNKNVYIGSYATEQEAKNALKKYHNENRKCVQVKLVKKLENQEVLYDFVMPETHSFLGGGFVNHNCDEFATLPRHIFEEVMSGFLSVSNSPIEQVKHVAKLKTFKSLKIPVTSEDDNLDILQNQLILSGTAYYKHNHFYHYYNQWREIIYNHNNPSKLEEIVGDNYDPEKFDPRQYCAIRIPIELTTEGFLDLEQINRNKASMNKDTFLREYGAVFSDDSDGFFKRSLLDSCVVDDDFKGSDGKIVPIFHPTLHGQSDKKYVFGVDPAHTGDNFAIIIIELDNPCRKIVYCWTTQSSDHKQRLKDKIITEHDYFHYCARQIRNLMKKFNCVAIALDSQGGGKSILEAFRDVTKIEHGESIILPIIDVSGKPQDTDSMPGEHIVHIFNNRSDTINEANNALRLDFEDKKLLFPFHDAVSFVVGDFYDSSLGDYASKYDTLNDCMYEIEELKIELSNIVVSETAMGRQKFDTPDIKQASHRKGRLKKDRYSALLMANYVARNLQQEEKSPKNPYDLVSKCEYSGRFSKKVETEPKFFGNIALCQKLNDLYKNV